MILECIIDEYIDLLTDRVVSNGCINNNSNIVKDVLHDSSNKILLVESPHREELYSGIPLSGCTGDYVTTKFNEVHLLNTTINEPFGPYVKNNTNLGFSIINVSSLPLQNPFNSSSKSDLLIFLLEHIRTNPHSSIDSSNASRKFISDFNCTLHDLIDTKIKLKSIMITDFSNRMNSITNFLNKKILICGSFAKKMFDEWFNISYSNTTQRNNIIDINHPSHNGWSEPPSLDQITCFLND